MDKIAVLIPCYNESRTIKKVVEDFKMYMIIILQTEPMRSQGRLVQSCAMSTNREREMLSAECSVILMQNVTS